MSKPGPDPTVTDDELINAIRHVRTPVAARGDIARQIEIGPERVRQRLKPLVADGSVQRGELNGGSVIVYWIED